MSGEKAQGQDDFPAWLLKCLSSTLSPWLSQLFTLILHSGYVPHQWQKGRLILLPKDGSMSPDQFRPITILSRIRILFEKALLRRIEHLTDTNCFQGGFKRGHRCQHWAGALHDIMQLKDSEGEELLTVSLDCHKAFDSVSFESLLARFRGTPYLAVLSNLVGRQRLRIHGTHKWIYPDRGTPQGGVLSPILFNCALENMHAALQSLPKVQANALQINHLQWADDLVLLANSEERMSALINCATKSLQRCGLHLNKEKSRLLTAGVDVPEVGGIRRAESLKYLGVHFNPHGIDAPKDWESRKSNLLKAAGTLRGLGFHKGGLSVTTRSLITKTFLIPRLTYALALYPATSIRKPTLEEADKLLIRLTFGSGMPVETGYVLLNSAPLTIQRSCLRARMMQAPLPPILSEMNAQRKEQPSQQGQLERESACLLNARRSPAAQSQVQSSSQRTAPKPRPQGADRAPKCIHALTSTGITRRQTPISPDESTPTGVPPTLQACVQLPSQRSPCLDKHMALDCVQSPNNETRPGAEAECTALDLRAKIGLLAQNLRSPLSVAQQLIIASPSAFSQLGTMETETKHTFEAMLAIPREKKDEDVLNYMLRLLRSHLRQYLEGKLGDALLSNYLSTLSDLGHIEEVTQALSNFAVELARARETHRLRKQVLSTDPGQQVLNSGNPAFLGPLLTIVSSLRLSFSFLGEFSLEGSSNYQTAMSHIRSMDFSEGECFSEIQRSLNANPDRRLHVFGSAPISRSRDFCHKLQSLPSNWATAALSVLSCARSEDLTVLNQVSEKTKCSGQKAPPNKKSAPKRTQTLPKHPRKRKRGNTVRKTVFLHQREISASEWEPKLKTAIEARSLKRKKYKLLSNYDQGIIAAFLSGRFPGKGPKCGKCSLREPITRGHMKRCHFLKSTSEKINWEEPCQDLRLLLEALHKTSRLLRDSE